MDLLLTLRLQKVIKIYTVITVIILGILVAYVIGYMVTLLISSTKRSLVIVFLHLENEVLLTMLLQLENLTFNGTRIMPLILEAMQVALSMHLGSPIPLMLALQVSLEITQHKCLPILHKDHMQVLLSSHLRNITSFFIYLIKEMIVMVYFFQQQVCPIILPLLLVLLTR